MWRGGNPEHLFTQIHFLGEEMNAEEMKERTKRFALSVLKFAESVPGTMEGVILAKQLIRSGTSVGANYRAACRARSKAEFASKLQIAQEEADESAYWIELLNESGIASGNQWEVLQKESNELTAILTASLITTRGLR